MSEQDIIAFWGSDNLHRWEVDATGLPEAARHFLADVGLPITKYFLSRFDPSPPDLPLVDGYPGHRRVIVKTWGPPVCLDEKDGTVVEGRMFVNSSVQQCGKLIRARLRFKQ